MRIPIRTIIVLVVFVIAPILLQIFLSKSKSKWSGLVLPIISFVLSLIWTLNIAVMDSIGETIVLIITTFLFANIPTIILLAIYFTCQRNVKKISEIDKMNIQDLE